jgi:hypothetical protein
MSEPKPGYIRIYDDHTGRSYTDMSQAEYDEMVNDPVRQEAAKIIREEIDAEIIKTILAAAAKD